MASIARALPSVARASSVSWLSNAASCPCFAALTVRETVATGADETQPVSATIDASMRRRGIFHRNTPEPRIRVSAIGHDLQQLPHFLRVCRRQLAQLIRADVCRGRAADRFLLLRKRRDLRDACV